QETRCPILAGQHFCVKWETTKLVKRSIKFGLACFPLNRSVSQKESENLSGKRKTGGNRACDALAGSTCRLSFSCSFSLVPCYVRRVRMLYGCCIIHLRSHTCSNCHMTN